MKKTLLIGSVLLAFAYPLANFQTGTNADVRILAQKPPKPIPKIKPNENIKKPDVPPTSDPQIKPNSSLTSEIKVINTGVDPKIPLRLTPKVNQIEKAKLILNADTQVFLKNTSFPAPKMPSLSFTLETTVTNVAKNGDIGFKFIVSDVDVINDKNTSEKIVKTIKEQVKKIVGFGGNFVIDNQGKPKSSKFNFPQSTDTMLQQLTEQINSSIQQIAGPLPTESVGVGAKWNVTQTMNSSIMKFDQTTTYEIVSLKNGKATLKVGLTQTAPAQKLNLPGLPPKANFDLKSYTATGEGQVMMTLTQLLPITSDIKMTSNMDGQLSLPSNSEQKKPGTSDKTELPLSLKIMVNAMMKSE